LYSGRNNRSDFFFLVNGFQYLRLIKRLDLFHIQRLDVLSIRSDFFFVNWNGLLFVNRFDFFVIEGLDFLSVDLLNLFLVDRENLFFVDRLMLMCSLDGENFLDDRQLMLLVVVIIVFGATSNVSDVSDETRVTFDIIVDDLTASVGQKNVVESLRVTSFAALELAHVEAAVTVFHGPFRFVVHGSNDILIFFIRRI